MASIVASNAARSSASVAAHSAAAVAPANRTAPAAPAAPDAPVAPANPKQILPPAVAREAGAFEIEKQIAGRRLGQTGKALARHEVEQFVNRAAFGPLPMLQPRLMGEAGVAVARSARRRERDRYRHRGRGGKRRIALQVQFLPLEPRRAGDERQMVVASPLSVATQLPSADLARLDRLRVVSVPDGLMIERQKIPKLTTNEAEIRGEVSDTVRADREGRVRRRVRRMAIRRTGRHDVKALGTNALNVLEQIDVGRELQNRSATRLARELRIVGLVRPRAERACQVHAAQNVGVARPLLVAERRLHDDLDALPHCVERGRGARGGRAVAGNEDDLEARGAQSVYIRLLVRRAAIAQRLHPHIVLDRLLESAGNDGEVEARAMPATEETRQIGGGKTETIRIDVH